MTGRRTTCGARREKLRVTLPLITAFDTLDVAQRLIRVVRTRPRSPCPSVSPTCNLAGMQSAFVYMSMRPLTAWLTTPDAPIDIMRPTNTLMLLEGLAVAAGAYGDEREQPDQRGEELA